MGGGLLNLISYGNQNIILSGNPSKTFFKCVYLKYTNFGLQKFRIDCEGSNRKLRETETSTFKFKVPRYADLLMDTYLVMDLPNIWSPILPPTTNNIDNVQPDDPNINRLVVVGGASLLQGGVTIAVSDDGGINWEAANSSDNIFAEGFDVIWLGNLTNPLWVAVGQPYTGVNNNTIVRSTNGRDWTSISNTPFGNNGSGYGIAYDSNNNLLISVGNNDPLDATSTCIGYSNDLGITWTKITNATIDGIVETINNIFDTGGITAISYGNGMWVAVGITSGIYAPYITSNDGINWIGYNTNLWDNKGFNKTSILHCSGNNWIMGGFATNPLPPDIAKGRILISNDNGISWSNTNLPTEDYAPNRVMSLSINPNNNIILGVGQGANIPGGNQQFYLMSSNDNGLNWTNLLNPLNNCGVTNGITGIFWNSTYNRWNLGGGGCENQLAYNNNLEGLGAWSISEPNGGNNLFPANLVSPVEVRNFAQGFLKGNIHPVIPSLPTLTDIWKPYEFKWIKDLGTQLIERVRFTVGGVTIQEFTGQYLRCMVERDFDNTKKDLYYKMTGNISELNDPANAFQRNGYYPNVYPTNIPNFNIVGPEPSIRARKLYIPLNIWFTLASKMAFPLICLNKQDLNIEVDLRPINELFIVRDIETLIYPTTNSPFLAAPDNGFPNIPSASASVGPHIKANFNNQLFKFYRFLQPPTWINKENKKLIVVAGGVNSPTRSSLFAYSLDGKNWITSPEQSIFLFITSIASNKKNFFVATGIKSDNIDNANQFAYSYDGINWLPSPTPVDSIFSDEGEDGGGYQIAYGNNMWVAVGSQIDNVLPGNQFAYSFDGINWLSSPTKSYKIFRAGTCVKYANGMWIAGGLQSNEVDPENTPNQFAYSFDGINWQASPTPNNSVFSWRPNAIEYGNNLWVAAQGWLPDGTTETAYSTDGINWVANPLSSIGLLISSWGSGALAYGNGIWVGVGTRTTQNVLSNEFVYSLNGKEWLPAETPPPNTIFGSDVSGYGMVIWDNTLQLFIATSLAASPNGSQSNQFAYSSDGKNWVSSPTVQGSIYEAGLGLASGYYFDDNLLILEDWEDKRTIWNADIHLISTYAFLSDEEIKVFTNKQQNYLVKQVYYFKHENVVESKKVNLFSTSGLVSDWMWYFQRNDVNLRNQWSNYTNWEYDYQPYSIIDPSGCFDIYSQNIVGTPNAASITINSNSLNPANNPGGYITNYKINGNYRLANQKNIMISWGLSLDGKYRENIQDAGVLDYIEKYTRTSGNAHDGLYCYNFCLQTNPLDFQPSGSMNLTDFNQIEFEVKTHLPTLDPNAQSLTICDPSGNFIAINKSNWRIYDYTYDLYIMEERYNILYFEDAKAHLVYAR